LRNLAPAGEKREEVAHAYCLAAYTPSPQPGYYMHWTLTPAAGGSVQAHKLQARALLKI